MPVSNAVVESVGIHCAIRLSNSANTVANATAIAVRSGSFTPSINVIPKPSTGDGGDMNFEAGMRSAGIEFVPRVNPTAPTNSLPYRLRDIVYFQFEDDGKFTYAGAFLVKSMPHSFTADGDATISMSGDVKPGWTMTENAAG